MTKTTCFCLLLFFNLCIYGQGVKIVYQAEMKEPEKEDNSGKSEALIDMKKRLFKIKKTILPRIKFIVTADREAYLVTYKRPMSIGDMPDAFVDLAVSTAIGNSIYVDLVEKTSYYIPSSLPFIRKVSLKEVDWEITQKSKLINNLKCYKAIARMEDPDAEYKDSVPITAWFCPAINFQAGPTAYASLPGVILELEMPTVIFKATNVETGDFKVGSMDTQDREIKPHKEFVAYFEEWNKENMPKN